MTIDRIKYEETFPTAIQYKNIRLTAEATIDSGREDVLECYLSLKQSVNDAFLLMNPSLPIASTDYHTGEQVEVKTEVVGDLSAHIESCTDLKVLESYKLLVKGKPDLEAVYLKKLNDLS